jgi:hypothetical protein
VRCYSILYHIWGALSFALYSVVKVRNSGIVVFLARRLCDRDGRANVRYDAASDDARCFVLLSIIRVFGLAQQMRIVRDYKM